jgi:dTDP-4-amino-4,6-dideoxygalactose transaminase
MDTQCNRTELLSGQGTAVPLFKVRMDSSVIEDVGDVLMSGYIGEGPKVKEFEAAISSYVGRNVVCVNSGTSAIRLALRLAGVGVGDEVISTPVTCVATNTAILEQGAKIVWADVHPRTGNILVSDVKKKITENTKAIICVHWGGYPCDLRALHEIEFAKNIPVIQDAAHAFGALCRGLPVSGWTRFTCFSFQAIKDVTCGDGGCLVCNLEDDYDLARELRWYGFERDAGHSMRCKQNITAYGYKYHMNDIAATIGLSCLEGLDDAQKRTQDNAVFYMSELRRLNGVALPEYSGGVHCTFWLFTIFVADPDRFEGFMKKKGITVSQVHMRNDNYTIFESFKSDNLLGVNVFSKHKVCIPVGWWVDDMMREHIVEMIKLYCKELGNDT